jgi:GNAT superfamily N-acetyltransferase
MSSIKLRPARVDEVAAAIALDDAACALYETAGVHVALPQDHLFALAERARWTTAAAAGRLFFALDDAGEPIGFSALDVLDGAAYLDQVSVHPRAGRRGIGRGLVEHAIAWAASVGDGTLWLTTYANLPWNRPFYESAGFVVVPESECGPAIRHHLAEQRAVLPAPEQRIAMRRPPSLRAAHERR